MITEYKKTFKMGKRSIAIILPKKECDKEGILAGTLVEIRIQKVKEIGKKPSPSFTELPKEEEEQKDVIKDEDLCGK